MKTFIILGAVLLAAMPAFATTGPVLSSISHPPVQIENANVVDAGGRIVGAVQRVEVTPDGRPTEVAVSLKNDQDRLLVLNADKVRYDAASNQIIAEAGSAQIEAMTDPIY